jgi:ubiquinone/menaquinone biosynthesis C-methylase UbiE
LDCGCGAGEYVFALRETWGTDAWGIEYLEDKVRKAKAHRCHSSRVKQGDIQNLNEPDSSYDVVLLNEVLEHVPDEKAALREVHRVLRPAGLLVVFSPNRWFPFETHGVRLRGTNIKIPPYLPFVPYIPLALGNLIFDYWARNYWQHELRELVRQAGFGIWKREYFWQTFENISGRQPFIVSKLKPLFRSIATVCEGLPLINRFGVSQVIIARRSESTPLRMQSH